MPRRLFRPKRDKAEARDERIMRWAGHVAGSKVKMHTVLVGKPEGVFYEDLDIDRRLTGK